MSDKDSKERNITNIIKDQESEPEGLSFPCKYPIKAMGENTNRFLQEMLFIAQKHCPDTQEHHVRSNKSKTGKYQSVTITVEIKSRAHLEGLYIEIKSHKDVKWIL
ncbi:MAG: DUF493 domain-containing protein [Alcanivoracaceae bacterium]|nr:DUF493 domain-containing protein [Alcanivoracaceae bacterium]